MQIVTERLLLREFEPGDLDAMLAYKFDPLYLRYYSQARAERQEEDVGKFLQKMLDEQKEQPRLKFQLAITLQGDQRMIGNAGVRKANAEDTTGDVGCELAPDYWGKGYATEATRAMVAYGFEGLHLHRLWASTMAGNVAARRILEKLGMRKEGELRETTLLADGWSDSVIYAILEPEWKARGEQAPTILL